MKHQRANPEQGDQAVSLILIAPVIMLILGSFIGLGRIALADMEVQTAANAAARAATLSQTQHAAQSSAHATATATLAQRGIRCTNLKINTSTNALNNASNPLATVNTTISCTVNLSDVSVPGLPGTRTITASGKSPVDIHRSK